MKNHPMKLLVAFDGSPGASAALDDLRHAGLSHQIEVEAVVMSVADVLVLPSSVLATAHPPQVAGVMAQAKRARENALRAVDEMRTVAAGGCERLCAMFPDWQVRSEARGDSPAWGVLKKEGEWQPDLTVVGANSDFSLEKLIFGSVAQKVVTQAKGSVRVGRSNDKNRGAPVRLILGLDGSPDATHALDAICARSFPPGSQVRMVTVLDSRMAKSIAMLLPALSRWTGDGTRSDGTRSDGTQSDAANDDDNDEFAWVSGMVEAGVAQLRAAGLDASGTVREGDSKGVLLAEAESWEADCIFIGATGLVGSSGLQNLERFFLGSTAMVVSSRATCSVEVIRTPTSHAPSPQTPQEDEPLDASQNDS